MTTDRELPQPVICWTDCLPNFYFTSSVTFHLLPFSSSPQPVANFAPFSPSTGFLAGSWKNWWRMSRDAYTGFDLPQAWTAKWIEQRKEPRSGWLLLSLLHLTTRVSLNSVRWDSPRFPAYAFVRACYESDSMMNRKRLWGIVKQVEEIW